MKIRYNGHTSFTFTTDGLVTVTDLASAKASGVKGLSSEADVVINSRLEATALDIKPVNREKVFEISSPGEYEIAGLMVQRPISGVHYVIDYDLIRIVYIGFGSKNIDVKQLRDLGDVDVLLLPYSDGEDFPSYDTIQEIISKVEPVILVPFGTDAPGSKSKEDFVKTFGYTTATTEKMLKVESKPEAEERAMRVVFLESK